MLRLSGGLLAGLGLWLAATGMAASEPLDKAACDAVKAEHGTLEAAGLRETLKKGAAWGKANLSAAKLKEVERFIGLEEQMLFRCGLAQQRLLPGAEGEETGDADKAAAPATATAAAPAAEAGQPASPPPKPKAKPKPKPKEAQATEPAEAPPKPKPKPKPKVDDAYRPPPPAPKE